jgi:DNA replication protein DnaC
MPRAATPLKHCLTNPPMMKAKPETIPQMGEYLGLKNLAHDHAGLIKLAHEKQLGLLDFLEMVLRQEVILKQECGIRYRISESRLPRPYKLLSDFDFGFQPSLRKSLVMDLATMEFMKHHESLLWIGDCGTGKSHLAQALGLIACEKGHKVLYTTCAALIGDLNNGVFEKNLPKRLRKYVNPDLLIIDEMGHDRLELQVTKEAHLLFKVVDERYHLNRPLIFTTNVEEKSWAEYLGDPVSTRAILDRIFHHAVKIEIRGPSYRQHQGMELQKKYENHK